MAKVAFLGLGVMGFPMAGYPAKNGHEVTVFNRTGAKANAWVAKHGGKAADTPKAAVQIQRKKLIFPGLKKRNDMIYP